ncbi:exodeoxyribonuclease VII large subunit [Oscillatoriales cyanobacterium LEGE 11467]|uniref:Exodeoxyribonuclease 7 large subunit n=2 Tax=Zarconia TaxID=2992130 RepID=A0A928W017_9CYAN|nr:exodeoxyribonuclease VII large subunit [Zarconia navalis LEGE 11467]
MMSDSQIANSPITDTALSVGGLTEYIQALLQDDRQLRQVWVTGEVSSTNAHRSGTFFTLRDTEGNATIRCVVWRSQLEKLAADLVCGEQFLVLGSIRVYPARGEYQLSVWQVLPAGEGLQALRYRQLRNRLEAEGLFDAAHKKTLPPHPQTIAVVTSGRAAAWGDIQRTLKQRYPGLRVLLSEAIVQGDRAPDSIAGAIARVEKDGRAEVLILSRGGGSVEDLACFNDERVVRAIATCSIPVIAGIGHQRDESLADLAADVCVHTPTAAAELVVPSLEGLREEHQARIEALAATANARLEAERNRLRQLQNRLQKLSLDQQLDWERKELKRLRQGLIRAARSRWQGATGQCQLLSEKLATLDPQGVLSRGYAAVRSANGEIVRSTVGLQEDDVLEVQLGEGRIRVKLIEILGDK